MKTQIVVNSIKIGITDCARYTNYEKWFLEAPEKVNVIRLSYRLSNLDDIKQCQGVVLSGGEDVDPRRYKRPDLLGRVEFTDIDEKRDDFEIQVIKCALQLKLPILSICRGMQLFNVYHGGTLIYDIPSVTKISGHAKVHGMDFS
jgi:putative glutamine amidotransferase